METQAYFDNIRTVIDQYLKQSTKTIDVAVAWFTDKQLFETLCLQARKGVKVRLLMFDDYEGAILDYDKAIESFSSVFYIFYNSYITEDREKAILMLQKT